MSEDTSWLEVCKKSNDFRVRYFCERIDALEKEIYKLNLLFTTFIESEEKKKES